MLKRILIISAIGLIIAGALVFTGCRNETPSTEQLEFGSEIAEGAQLLYRLDNSFPQFTYEQAKLIREWGNYTGKHGIIMPPYTKEKYIEHQMRNY